MKFVYPIGATPYNQDEALALIPRHITTQNQLNEWEQANIIEAEQWLFSRKHKNMLSLEMIKGIHKKMFDKTWKWAGKFRTYNTNIGLPYPIIQESLKTLQDDAIYWINNKTFPTDEIASRVHHRLVFIHPFPNGNGRLARLIIDGFLVSLGAARFSWGNKSLDEKSLVRTRYIHALQQADGENFQPLLEFVRS